MDDLVEAYEAFIDRASELKGSVLNMGGGPRFTLSLLELLAVLEKGLDRRNSVPYADWRPADQRVYISDMQKAREQLRWKPEGRTGGRTRMNSRVDQVPSVREEVGFPRRTWGRHHRPNAWDATEHVRTKLNSTFSFWHWVMWPELARDVVFEGGMENARKG